MEGYTRILVPIDFSKESRHAAERALDLVERDGRVDLLHVIHMPIPITPAAPMIPVSIEPKEGDLLLELKRFADRLGARKRSVELRPVVERGIPSKVIVDRSAEYELIVMTPKDKGRLQRFLLGSVADEAVRRAECPVLIERISVKNG